MKKLIIGMSAIVLAVSTQAAAVVWKSGTNIKPDGSTAAASGTLNTYVWVVGEEAYGKMAMDSIWSTYGNADLSEITGYDASAIGKGSSNISPYSTSGYTVTPPESGTDTYYGIVITTYDSNKDGKADMYAVNKVEAYMNSAGTASGGANVARYISGGSDPVKWETVPEPTSGLLLLLGVAGLALRRRRA